DADREEIASDYDLPRLYAATSSGGGRRHPDSILSRVDVTAGQTYLVQAAGFQGSTGSYRLTVAFVDDFDDDYANAHPIRLAADGSATLDGAVEKITDRATGETAADRDEFQFVATGTGQETIRLAALPGSKLLPDLVVSDSSDAHNEI